MGDVNVVVLGGRLTRDVEIRYTPSGTPVATFGLAVNRYSKDAVGETKNEASFFDIVAFGKTAEASGQYLSKGSSVVIEGVLQQRRWETDDGQKRSKVEIVANRVHFQGKPKGQDESASSHGEPEAADFKVPF